MLHSFKMFLSNQVWIYLLLFFNFSASAGTLLAGPTLGTQFDLDSQSAKSFVCSRSPILFRGFESVDHLNTPQSPKGLMQTLLGRDASIPGLSVNFDAHPLREFLSINETEPKITTLFYSYSFSGKAELENMQSPCESLIYQASLGMVLILKLEIIHLDAVAKSRFNQAANPQSLSLLRFFKTIHSRFERATILDSTEFRISTFQLGGARDASSLFQAPVECSLQNSAECTQYVERFISNLSDPLLGPTRELQSLSAGLLTAASLARFALTVHYTGQIRASKELLQLSQEYEIFLDRRLKLKTLISESSRVPAKFREEASLVQAYSDLLANSARACLQNALECARVLTRAQLLRPALIEPENFEFLYAQIHNHSVLACPSDLNALAASALNQRALQCSLISPKVLSQLQARGRFVLIEGSTCGPHDKVIRDCPLTQ